MAFEKDFEELMPQTITIDTQSRDKYGKLSATGSPTSYTKTRIIFDTRTYRTPEGDTVVEFGKIYLNQAVTNINDTDKLTLPGGAVVQVVSVNQYPDESGNHHTVLRFGASSVGRPVGR
jgi:hypothetical protein